MQNENSIVAYKIWNVIETNTNEKILLLFFLGNLKFAEDKAGLFRINNMHFTYIQNDINVKDNGI